MAKICSFDGCSKPNLARSFCTGHYQQLMSGKVMAEIVTTRLRVRGALGYDSIEDFFWERVDKTGACWMWVGKKTVDGYPQIKFKGRTTYAHRFSWELLRGPIADGYFIDHLCHIPSCVNPDHLRATAPKGNSENRQGPAKHSKSGVRGVYFDGIARKWRSEVRHKGKVVYVGRFDSLDVAAEAARNKRAELFAVSN